MRSRALFDYGSRAGRDLSSGPLAVIDVETTGLSPAKHRVIEIAVARVEDGCVVDEWSSLIDPGCDPGPTFVHRITSEHLEGAPAIGEVVGEVFERLDGAVVVAHNASFEERFLAAEFTRMGVRVPTMPAICTLVLARQLLATPNHRLQTCCESSGVELADAHTALGDVRATAALVGCLLEENPRLRWASAAPALPRVAVTRRPRTRASSLRKGEDGWMASLLSKLPLSTSEIDDGAAEAYLAAAEAALSDGKLIGDEARELARLAGEAGLGAAQVRTLNHRLLDGLRDAALDDDILTTTELAGLHNAAVLLAEPEYFADLVATIDDSSRRAAKSPKGRGRIWVHPDLGSDVTDRVSAAGFTLGKNMTRTLVAVVVPAGLHDDHLRVARARELGIKVVTDLDLGSVLGEVTDSQVPPPYRGPVPPRTAWAPEPQPERERVNSPAITLPSRGWYPDPAGRYEYRYWNGTDWTDHVATGGVTVTDPPVP